MEGENKKKVRAKEKDGDQQSVKRVEKRISNVEYNSENELNNQTKDHQS